MPKRFLSLQHNLVTHLSFILLLLITAGIIYVMDFSHRREKVILIRAKFNDQIEWTVQEDLISFSREILEASPGEPAREKLTALDRLMEAIIADSNNSICQIHLVDSRGVAWNRRENPLKMQALQDSSNTLFAYFGDFTHTVIVDVPLPSDLPGHLLFDVTNPPGDIDIIELTSRYRMWLSTIIVLLYLCYWLFYRLMLLPLNRVTQALQQSVSGKIREIAGPNVNIERAYNRMAANTKAVQAQLHITDILSASELLTSAEIVRDVSQTVREIMGYDRVLFFNVDLEGPRPRLVSRPAAGESEDNPMGHQVAELWVRISPAFAAQGAPLLLRPDQNETNDAPFQISTRVFEILDCRSLIVAPVSFWDKLSGVILADNHTSDRDLTDDDVHLLRGVSQQIALGLERIILQQRILERNRTQVSINLSRNIGHDLTNLIASSRWHINTIKDALEAGVVKVDPSDERQRLFWDSIDGVLNSVRFFQELVDIYQALGRLNRPQFEQTDLNQLVADTVELFRRTTTRQIRFVVEAAPDLPPLRLEPHLMRLALFNLLANAVHAIGAVEGLVAGRGETRVSTAVDPEAKKVALRISDTGPGIRDRSGRLLEPYEMNQVFEPGYTTRDEGEGSGIGLNWVRTIIVDLHGGAVTAKNREKGGAEFEVVLSYEEASSFAPDVTTPVEPEKGGNS